MKICMLQNCFQICTKKNVQFMFSFPSLVTFVWRSLIIIMTFSTGVTSIASARRAVARKRKSANIAARLSGSLATFSATLSYAASSQVPINVREIPIVDGQGRGVAQVLALLLFCLAMRVAALRWVFVNIGCHVNIHNWKEKKSRAMGTVQARKSICGVARQ